MVFMIWLVTNPLFLVGVVGVIVILLVIFSIRLLRYGKTFRVPSYISRMNGLSKAQYQQLQKQLDNNQYLIQGLMNILNTKQITLKEREATIDKWISTYNTLAEHFTTCISGNHLMAKANEKIAVGGFEEGAQYVQQSLEQYLDTKEKDRAFAASAAFALGCIKELQLNYQQANIYYEQAVHLEPNMANYLNSLGRILSSLGDYERAKNTFERLLAINKQLYEHSPANILATLNHLGKVSLELRDLYKAKEYYEQALTIGQQVCEERNPDLAITLENLGGLCSSAFCELEKGRDYFKQALILNRRIYGKRHPKVAILLYKLGTAWFILHEKQKGRRFFKHAVRISRRFYGDRHPQLAELLNQLVESLKGFNEYKPAIMYCEQLLAIDRQIYGEQHPDVARDLNNLGLAWESLGKYQKAIMYFEQVLAIKRQIYSDQHWQVAITLHNLGRAWESLGKYQQALTLLKQAEKIIKEESQVDSYVEMLIKNRIEHIEKNMSQEKRS